MPKVLKDEADHYYWNKHKEYVELMEGIEENTRSRFINAMNFLEKEFGRKFLKAASFNHPVQLKISNKAPWQIDEIIEFVDTLQMLKTQHCNYNRLIKKILSEKESKKEGIPLVEIVRGYIKENFKIFFLDEANINGIKTPDIRLENPDDGDTFYIEVTMPDESYHRNKTRKNYDFFYKEFQYVQPLFSFCGKQSIPIREDDYPEIKEIIAAARNKVISTDEIVEYSDERFLFLLAPLNKETQLSEFCRKNRIEINNFESLHLDFDDGGRIDIDKAKQIPEGSNGLLYAVVNSLYFITVDINDTIARLEPKIAKHKNLLGVVLLSTIVDSAKDDLEVFGNHFFAQRTIKNLSYKSLFISNNNCNVVVSEETIQRIYKALGKYISG